MRNLIGMSMLAAMLLVSAGNNSVQAKASINVSFNFNAGYVTCFNSDMDFDNIFVLDNTRIGMWVMRPSGRWVLRVRNMWWNTDLDDWVFGPWYYDYSIAYCVHSHHHFYRHISFHPVLFHVYMNNHHRNWHRHYYHKNHGRYRVRYSRSKDHRRNRYHTYNRVHRKKPGKGNHRLATKNKEYKHGIAIKSKKHGLAKQNKKHGLAKNNKNHSFAKRNNKKKIKVVHKTKRPVRIEHGHRNTRIDYNRRNAKRVNDTHTRTKKRHSRHSR